MKKSILNLGKALNKEEQKQISGGRTSPYDPWDLSWIPEDYWDEECSGWTEGKGGEIWDCDCPECMG